MTVKFNPFFLKALCIAAFALTSSCSKKSIAVPDTVKQPENPPVTVPETGTTSEVETWLTSSDQSILFQKQSKALNFTTIGSTDPTISINEGEVYQSIDGFGYTLTGGSASLINNLEDNQRAALLKELFLTDNDGIGVSYLRISIGASDLSSSAFTYNDMPSGQTDPTLASFSISREKTDLIPVLKQIIALNPSIKIMGSPWSAPAWMKTNNSLRNGSLKPEYYQAYATYFVKYIKNMQAEGINIDAITPQNEPLNGNNNPSMVMTAVAQAEFIKNHLGPQFAAAGIKTKIIIYDHNADKPEYPISILDDSAVRAYVDGSAFHLYGGNIAALSEVHANYPDKNIYFTEQWTAGSGSFDEALKWHINNLIIGATRNWSRNVLEWNLASDENLGPHTIGGCSDCLGALTVNGSTVNKNVAYYIIAHASKFVRPESVRIGSSLVTNLPNVAFKTKEGKKVLIVLNNTSQTQKFNIKFNNKYALTSLDKGSVATYIF